MNDPYMGSSVAISLVIMYLTFYFVPTFLAFARRHPSKGKIFLLNVLTGWTVLGWVIAIVWAFSNDRRQSIVINNYIDRGAQ